MIAVVIPCFRVKRQIDKVLASIGPEVGRIFVVDDCCPEQSGAHVAGRSTDDRIAVLTNDRNLGVGGATLRGFVAAAAAGAEIVVKIDGDGQTDPRLIPQFVKPIRDGECDYTKGNRFFAQDNLSRMPRQRLLGNALLSFLAKFSTGYWHIFDPNNGLVALHAKVFALIPVDKVSQRYFFESDMLFRLNIAGARVLDVPMKALYADEVSNLRPLNEIPRFAVGHVRNFFKRIVYSYYVRDFSIASLELPMAVVMIAFGLCFGLLKWGGDTAATAGTVMLAALPLIIGVQLLLAFLNYDIAAVPRAALHPRLPDVALPAEPSSGDRG